MSQWLKLILKFILKLIHRFIHNFMLKINVSENVSERWKNFMFVFSILETLHWRAMYEVSQENFVTILFIFSRCLPPVLTSPHETSLPAVFHKCTSENVKSTPGRRNRCKCNQSWINFKGNFDDPDLPKAQKNKVNVDNDWPWARCRSRPGCPRPPPPPCPASSPSSPPCSPWIPSSGSWGYEYRDLRIWVQTWIPSGQRQAASLSRRGRGRGRRRQGRPKAKARGCPSSSSHLVCC